MSDECCYVCNECPNSYATLDDLEQHMEQMHAGIFRSDAVTANGTTTGTAVRLTMNPEMEDDEDEDDDGQQQYSMTNDCSRDEQKVDTMEHVCSAPLLFFFSRFRILIGQQFIIYIQSN